MFPNFRIAVLLVLHRALTPSNDNKKTLSLASMLRITPANSSECRSLESFSYRGNTRAIPAPTECIAYLLLSLLFLMSLLLLLLHIFLMLGQSAHGQCLGSMATPHITQGAPREEADQNLLICFCTILLLVVVPRLLRSAVVTTPWVCKKTCPRRLRSAATYHRICMINIKVGIGLR